MSKARPLIAVVDDERAIRIALQRLLRSSNLDVETFPSGDEFLESLKTHQPDCVVLDLHMPSMDGFAVQSRLADASIRLPVVIITGYDSAETRERALVFNAAAYLCKPVDDETLLDAISSAIVLTSVTTHHQTNYWRVAQIGNQSHQSPDGTKHPEGETDRA